ncbi:MAG TPA: hypothetical protein VGX76_17185 [Pirellulales bacterium]|jgi:hypothetical protein|nr:hypothetical protein [Pirellulales bacterium]
MPATGAPASVSAPDAAQVRADAPSRKRFDIFIVDVGWHSPVADVLRKNLEKCAKYQWTSNTYVLTHDQCVALFRKHPSMIGTEPSVIVIDREAYAARRSNGFGFKVNLGMIRDVATANNLLKWILGVLAEQKPGSDITAPVRCVIHKEGLRGAISIAADLTRSPMGEAATH